MRPAVGAIIEPAGGGWWAPMGVFSLNGYSYENVIRCRSGVRMEIEFLRMKIV
jgi:hypothetical protein